MDEDRILGTPSFGWTDPRGGRWVVTLTWSTVEGRAECVGVRIVAAGVQAPGDALQPLTSSIWRSFPVGQTIERQAAGWEDKLKELVETGGQISERWEEQLAAFRQHTGRRGGRPPDPDKGPDHFREVALCYAEAWRRRERPRQAVAKRWGISPSTASKWIARARDLGFLSPTSAGRAGGIDQVTDPDESGEGGEA